MKLECVLVACNENTNYLDFWPIVKHAWWSIAHLPCILVYVGETLPEHLTNDPAVKHFKPIRGWPTATQAQCIRLLYPALLKCQGAVMISDMDMIPMQRDWFIDGFNKYNSSQFVSLRGIDEGAKQIYMCYVGATPKVWGDLFEIQNEQDIQTRLQQWSNHYASDGQKAGSGWCSDQIILYNRVKQLQAMHPDRVGLDPWTSEICRLDRGRLKEWIEMTPQIQEYIKLAPYVDFHMPPWNPFHPLIVHILKLRESVC